MTNMTTGTDILYLNCEDNPITFNKKNYLLRAAERMGLTCVQDLKNKKDTEPTDYVLNIEPYTFHGANKWVGVWEIDLLLDRPEYDQEVWKQVHTIFIAILSMQVKMEPFKDKVIPLFQAIDTDIHKRLPDIKQEYDFVHAGTRRIDIYSERDRLIELLQKEGFGFRDYGKEMRPWDYMKRLNTAKVQFIRSMGKDYETAEAAQRFFECMALGPTLVMNCSELPYLTIEEGVDYFSYKDDAQLLQKMHYLIDHPDFAYTMAERGRKKMLQYHTYEKRLSTILDHLKHYDFTYRV